MTWPNLQTEEGAPCKTNHTIPRPIEGVPDGAFEDVTAFVSDLAERGFVRRELAGFKE